MTDSFSRLSPEAQRYVRTHAAELLNIDGLGYGVSFDALLEELDFTPAEITRAVESGWLERRTNGLFYLVDEFVRMVEARERAAEGPSP